jgi:hypothetical protein
MINAYQTYQASFKLVDFLSDPWFGGQTVRGYHGNQKLKLIRNASSGR